MRFLIIGKGELDIREVVADPEWQSLRESFVGTWKETPVKNVSRLRQYLGDRPWTNPSKLRRVHNYLTGSGFRTKAISHPAVDGLLVEVRRAREKLSR